MYSNSFSPNRDQATSLFPGQRRGAALSKGVLGLLVLLAGCAAPIGPGQVARDWSCKLREMQVRPIFPPREDVQVGDIYWLDAVAATDQQAYCTDTKEFLPIHRWSRMWMSRTQWIGFTRAAPAFRSLRQDRGP